MFSIPKPLFVDQVLFYGNSKEVYFLYQDETDQIWYAELNLGLAESDYNTSSMVSKLPEKYIYKSI